MELGTIRDILNWAAEYLEKLDIPSARLDSEILLSHILKKDRTYLYQNPEFRIQNPEIKIFKEFIERRRRREPVSYITGEKEFWSLKFKVTRDTLIPRTETEILVQTVLDIIKDMKDEGRRTKDETSSLIPLPSSLVLDIGTGSGNIAISIAKEVSESHIFAIDRSDAALSVARENAIAHGVKERITFSKGDLYSLPEKFGLQYEKSRKNHDPLQCFAAMGAPPVFEATLPKGGRERSDRRKGRGTHCSEALQWVKFPSEFFDIIVSNPPYIPTGDIETLMADVKDWEPRGALDGGKDGLDAIRKITADAPGLLKHGGHIAMEIGFNQAEDVKNIIEETGKFSDIKFVKDLAGIERVVTAKLKCA